MARQRVLPRRPGLRARGSGTRAAPHSSTIWSFLTQASTEAQGPWDSNYQIEDHFSWFVPGKKGDHDLKFGVAVQLHRARYASRRSTRTARSGSTTDLPFDAANPRTYPERLTIRVGEFEEFINNHTVEMYAQDKWKMGGRTTLSAGVRYDLEIIPLNETDNPLFPAGNKNYPVDRNNFSPRIGLTHALDDAGQIGHPRRLRDVLQPDAPGLDRRHDGAREVHLVRPTVNFPNNNADPGPGAGPVSRPIRSWSTDRSSTARCSTSSIRPECRRRNAGEVVFDSPDRKQPYAHQVTVGYRSRVEQLARRSGRLHSHGEQGHVPRAQPQPDAAREHEPHRSDHTRGCVWRAGRSLYRSRSG